MLLPHSAGNQRPLEKRPDSATTNKRESDPVIRHTNPIDHRPFQPKAKLENQQALVALYRAIGIQDVAQALHHLRPLKADRPSAAAA